MASHDSLKEQRDYAWSYFQLHANQGMSSFNFFVVIAALLTTGAAATLKNDFERHYVGVVLALSLVGVSFIFWKMDQRVRYLIKHAEKALKALEEEWITHEGCVGEIALFQTEEVKTDRSRGLRSWKFWQWHLSYAKCFGLVYLLFGLLGLVGCIAAILKWTV